MKLFIAKGAEHAEEAGWDSVCMRRRKNGVRTETELGISHQTLLFQSRGLLNLRRLPSHHSSILAGKWQLRGTIVSKYPTSTVSNWRQRDRISLDPIGSRRRSQTLSSGAFDVQWSAHVPVRPPLHPSIPHGLFWLDSGEFNVTSFTVATVFVSVIFLFTTL